MKKKMITMMLALALLLCMGLSGCANGVDVSEAASGTMRVYCTYEAYCEDLDLQLGDELYASLGTAFGVGDAGEETDIFVTNAHVIEDASETWTLSGVLSVAFDSYEASYYLAYFEELGISGDTYVTVTYTLKQVYLLEDDFALLESADGTLPTLDTSHAISCSVLYQGGSDDPDIAVLQASEKVEGRIALPLQSATEASQGDTVYALGYPVEADDIQNVDYPSSTSNCVVTQGNFSNLSLNSDLTGYDLITHTATVNSGNSGGPLLTEDGAVIGINTFIYKDGDYFLSVTSDDLMEVLDDLGIEYDLYESGLGLPVIIAIVAVVVIIIVVVIILVMMKKKKKKPEPQTGTTGGVPVPPAPPVAPVTSTAASSSIPNDSGLRIQATSGTFAGRRFAIAGRLRIGRDPQQNDLVYPAGTQGVSGKHCVLTYQNGNLFLQDVGSTYGTFLLNGQRVAANQTVVLQPGDGFYLATEKESFIIVRKGEG